MALSRKKGRREKARETCDKSKDLIVPDHVKVNIVPALPFRWFQRCFVSLENVSTKIFFERLCDLLLVHMVSKVVVVT